MTRLWGQRLIGFVGHDYKTPLEAHETFEEMSNEELSSYAAIIVSSAIVSERLRYTGNEALPRRRIKRVVARRGKATFIIRYVDSFRFDERSILTRGENRKPVAHPPVAGAIEQNATLEETKIIAEAWDAAGPRQVGEFPGNRRARAPRAGRRKRREGLN